MSLPKTSHQPNFTALTYACVSTIFALVISLCIGVMCGDTYRQRATIYCVLLLWSCCGAITIYFCTQKESGKITVKKLILWIIALWLWPIFLLRYLKRS